MFPDIPSLLNFYRLHYLDTTPLVKTVCKFFSFKSILIDFDLFDDDDDDDRFLIMIFSSFPVGNEKNPASKSQVHVRRKWRRG